MNLTLIMIVIVVGILASIYINHFFPYFSLPLIQIFLGFIIGISAIGGNISIDSDLIMILVIVPLLYYESKNANTKKYYEQRTDIFWYAFPIVLITVVFLGFYFNYTVPILPIASCFALAAALSPTDAVTVTSLSKRVVLSEKNKILLEAEGLMNDASGITAFQLASLALVSGTFSFSLTIQKLLYIAIGGVIFGFIISWIKNRLVNFLRKHGIDDINFYLIIDFILPFITYLVASYFNTSGVLAVVVVGLLEAIKLNSNSLFEAKLDSVSKTTWDVIETILSSLVFIYLGLQLPSIFNQATMMYGNVFELIGIIILSTIVLFLLRFVLLVGYRLIKTKFKEKINLKEQLILTISGVKGTVTLATISSLPYVIGNNEVFSERYLLIFIAAGVIVCSIICAVVFLPMLLEQKEEEKDNDLDVLIAKEVIAQLKLEKNKTNTKEINAVIKTYQDRIRRVARDNNTLTFKQQKRIDKNILHITLDIEYDESDRLLKNGEITQEEHDNYHKMLSIFLRRSKKAGSYRLSPRHIYFRLIVPRRRRNKINEIQSLENFEQQKTIMKEIFIHNRMLVIEKIKNMETEENKEYIKFKVKEEEKLIDIFDNAERVAPSLVNINPNYTNEMEKAFQFERNIIQKHFENGDIDREKTVELKQNVNVLEEYYLMDTDSNLSYYFLRSFMQKTVNNQ
ncbi:Na+/H+ antiporter [Bacilli bacterium PM5-3]|nr:Na+/H+ antiporter [Bacilli bacterium PM5-3]